MRAVDTIVISAPRAKVYALASDLEGYANLAEEYKDSKVVSRDDRGAVVERTARIAGLPCKWTSRATFGQDEWIRFEQTRGILKGMVTTWRFADAEGGTEVVIEHCLEPRIPVIGEVIARKLIYNVFISSLVKKILRNLKALAEADS